MTAADERLVVVAGHTANETLARVRAVARVSQIGSSRVVIVEGADASVLRSIPGVVAATAAELPPAVMAGLDESEALFAEAWASRVQQAKTRAGDGLSWDAPGFQPPDPPPGTPGAGDTGAHH